MPFPTTPILDEFDVGANQNLTARPGWGSTVFFGGTDTSMKTDAVPTTAIHSGTPTWSGNWWNQEARDSEVWGTFAAPGGTTWLYLRAAGQNTATPNAYFLTWIAGTGAFTLGVMTAGSTPGSSQGSQVLSAGDSIGMQAIGKRISAWYQPSGGAWTQVFGLDDTTWNTGVPAWEINQGGQTWARVGGGVSPASPTIIGAVPYAVCGGG
jgi:hypothetical protein